LNTLKNIIEVKNLTFAWPTCKPLFNQFNLEIERHQKTYIAGASGSGKSTLLNLLAGVLDTAQGEIWFNGHAFHQLSRSQKDKIRGQEMGFIFQQFNLIPYLSTLDNIILPLNLFQSRKKAALELFESMQDAAVYLMERLSLPSQLLRQPVYQLSVGQQQRVAAARAFIGNPKIVIADEPSSALDWENQAQFLKLFLELGQSQNITLLLVSHDERLAPHFDQRINLPNGLGH